MQPVLYRASFSGLVTTVAAVAPLVVQAVRDPGVLGVLQVQVALLAGLVFVAPFVLDRRDRRPAPARVSLWRGAVQVAAALTAVAAVPFPLAGAPTPVLLCVVALPRFAFAGLELAGTAAVLLQTGIVGWTYRGDMVGTVGFGVFVAAVFGLQAFVFSSARLAAREARARNGLERSLAELSVAETVASSGERLAERVRLGRELHDAVGHHLTTLSLHLDLARRQDAETSRTTLDTAHSICRLLLAEVRDVLADVRRLEPGSLTAAIEGVVANLPPGLEVRLDVEPGAADGGWQLSPDVGHVLLRALQELLTNVLRHADASTVAVRLRRTADGVVLEVEDDGRGLGASAIPRRAGRGPGSGLEGMRGRLETLGGHLDVGPGPGGRGTRAVVSLPDADLAGAGGRESGRGSELGRGSEPGPGRGGGA